MGYAFDMLAVCLLTATPEWTVKGVVEVGVDNGVIITKLIRLTYPVLEKETMQ